jgi:hypothetical protein
MNKAEQKLNNPRSWTYRCHPGLRNFASRWSELYLFIFFKFNIIPTGGKLPNPLQSFTCTDRIFTEVSDGALLT